MTEREEERDAYARFLASSNISNADFHAALEQFDAETSPTESGNEQE